MPGHHCPESKLPQLTETVTKLDGLIRSHDVVFLLTDTRESRWLPTVIATAHQRNCVSVALGFDTFSVVRSGTGGVGCYFCNDVIGPVDTMTDRTLDMQCTVTRPGVAPLASAIGVELWVSMLQRADAESTESILGSVPHQIRGFLHSWEIMAMPPGRFANCVACSQGIVEGYRGDGPGFVERAVNHASFLEDVSGITALKAATVDDPCEWLDD
jgi:ubiquitin-like modifier-activating enzyme ATG7